MYQTHTCDWSPQGWNSGSNRSLSAAFDTSQTCIEKQFRNASGVGLWCDSMIDSKSQNVPPSVQSHKYMVIKFITPTWRIKPNWCLSGHIFRWPSACELPPSRCSVYTAEYETKTKHAFALCQSVVRTAPQLILFQFLVERFLSFTSFHFCQIFIYKWHYYFDTIFLSVRL